MNTIKQEGVYFYIGESLDTKQAYIKFKIEDNVLVLKSTVVDESLRGQGIAALLVEHVVHYARANKLLVKPLCSYAVVQFERKVEYQDVLLQEANS